MTLTELHVEVASLFLELSTHLESTSHNKSRSKRIRKSLGVIKAATADLRRTLIEQDKEA